MKLNLSNNTFKFLVLNLTLILLEIIYLVARIPHLNTEIPLWYTMPWGLSQLASKQSILAIPISALLIVLFGIVLAKFSKDKNHRYGEQLTLTFVSLCNLLLFYSALRIVKISSLPFRPLVEPGVFSMIPPMLAAFALVYFITPKALEILKEKGIITDPEKHKHPGMLLTKPSARGGGMIFALGFIAVTLIFVKISPLVLSLVAAVFLAALLGLLDDVQNTKPISKLSKLENPALRLFLQGLIVLPIIFAGIQILFVGNPFNGILNLDTIKFSLAGYTILPVAFIFTAVWILWIMNVLSWSNGVDGQYSGVVGIASIVIALIAMRETNFSPELQNVVTLAAITAGASFGLLPYTWHPSKVMWGFGAGAAGVVIATLSVLTEAKIATALIVLAIPFLDGAITVIRRLAQGKSPLKNDRGHLHHILLERGWSVRQVAVFYWVSTIFSGIIGIASADKDPMLAALTLAGGVAFLIVLINAINIKAKRA